MTETLEKIAGIMDTVVEDFFVKGKLPGEYAYAAAVVARAYVVSLLGDDIDKNVIEAFEAHQEHAPVMFPGNQAIESHLINLEEQKKMLWDSTAARNEMMFIRKRPALRLVAPTTPS